MTEDIGHKARRIAAGAATGAVAAWALKALAIAVAGGLDRSPLEGPLFLAGLLLLVLAFVATGVGFAGARPVGRVLGGLAAGVVGVVLFVLVETGVGALVPESAGWVREEAGLWVVSVVTALALLAALPRRTGLPGRAGDAHGH